MAACGTEISNSAGRLEDVDIFLLRNVVLPLLCDGEDVTASEGKEVSESSVLSRGDGSSEVLDRFRGEEVLLLSEEVVSESRGEKLFRLPGLPSGGDLKKNDLRKEPLMLISF